MDHILTCILTINANIELEYIHTCNLYYHYHAAQCRLIGMNSNDESINRIIDEIDRILKVCADHVSYLMPMLYD